MSEADCMRWEFEALKAELRGSRMGLELDARELVRKDEASVKALWMDNVQTYERHSSSRLRSIAKRAFGRFFKN